MTRLIFAAVALSLVAGVYFGPTAQAYEAPWQRAAECCATLSAPHLNRERPRIATLLQASLKRRP